MSEKIKDYFKLKEVCRTAGLWYVGSFMAEYIKRRKEWENPDTKQDFIKSMYNEYQGIDDNISGTRTRVNAMIRIIESRRVEEALQLVLDSNNKKIGCSESKVCAEKVLNLLKQGELTY